MAAALVGVLAAGDERFRAPDASSPTALSLDAADQWSISWTNERDVYAKALPLLPAWSSTLTDPDAASAEFWPTIAAHGFAYNLLIAHKIGDVAGLKRQFAEVWDDAWDAAAAAGALYVIDLSLFASLRPVTVSGFTRFTPSTITLLQQDPTSKALTPIAVRVAGHNDRHARLFSRAKTSSSAWLYALQAAKASITVYGIWLGHVYHWHIVTASMQMTMYNNLPEDHPLYLLLAPQSKYLFQFDEILLLLWDFIAPPTSVGSPLSFLRLLDRFAKGRSYFDDDPKSTLRSLGIEQQDFSWQQPWDRYPIVADFLTVWDAVEDYVGHVVDASYASDAEVAADRPLQRWMAAAADPDEGNIRGLPPMTSREALQQVLTSMVYRIVVHGSSRMNATANPALTFVANFPPCLQDANDPGAGCQARHQGAAGLPAQDRHDRPDGDVLLHLCVLGALRAADPGRRRRGRPVLSRRPGRSAQPGVGRVPAQDGGLHAAISAGRAPDPPMAPEHRDLMPAPLPGRRAFGQSVRWPRR